MTKKILATIFFLGLMLGMPAKAEAAAMIEVIDTEIQNVSLSVNESVLMAWCCTYTMWPGCA